MRGVGGLYPRGHVVALAANCLTEKEGSITIGSGKMLGFDSIPTRVRDTDTKIPFHQLVRRYLCRPFAVSGVAQASLFCLLQCTIQRTKGNVTSSQPTNDVIVSKTVYDVFVTTAAVFSEVVLKCALR